MLRGAKVVVVFPPVSVSPDFIDYPYFADLGAIQTAATLRAAGAEAYVSKPISVVKFVETVNGLLAAVGA